jgi:hypothetical protein
MYDSIVRIVTNIINMTTPTLSAIALPSRIDFQSAYVEQCAKIAARVLALEEYVWEMARRKSNKYKLETSFYLRDAYSDYFNENGVRNADEKDAVISAFIKKHPFDRKYFSISQGVWIAFGDDYYVHFTTDDRMAYEVTQRMIKMTTSDFNRKLPPHAFYFEIPSSEGICAIIRQWFQSTGMDRDWQVSTSNSKPQVPNDRVRSGIEIDFVAVKQD